MSEFYLRNVIEAALLAAGRPLKGEELKKLFDESASPSDEALREAVAALSAEYSGRGIELKETASGLRIQVRKEVAGEVSRLWPERPARYSRALLETLALIAYRQPITRGEIEDVRGVAVNPNIIKTLLERNWVRVVGQRDVPGRPELLGTTREFLDYFGLVSLDELPPLSELKAVGDLNLQLDLGSGAGAQSEAPREGAEPVAGEGGSPEEAQPDGMSGPQASAAETASGGDESRSEERLADAGQDERSSASGGEACASTDGDAQGSSEPAEGADPGPAAEIETADEGSAGELDGPAEAGEELDADQAPRREMRAAPGDPD